MKTAAPRSIALVFALVTVALCATWFFLASTAPDGLERVAARLGFAARERTVLRGPLAGYEVPWLASPVLRKIAAALLGASLCFLAALGWGRYGLWSRRRAASGKQEAGGRRLSR